MISPSTNSMTLWSGSRTPSFIGCCVSGCFSRSSRVLITVTPFCLAIPETVPLPLPGGPIKKNACLKICLQKEFHYKEQTADYFNRDFYSIKFLPVMDCGIVRPKIERMVGAEEEEGLPLPPPVLPQEPLRQQNLHLPLPAASKE
jgi:hypothetical protein